MKKITFLTTAFILSFFANAQVLFTENFNSYPTGHLNSDYTGTTAGQGGWVADRHPSSIVTAMVTPETGKGNVLNIITNHTSPTTDSGITILQKDIDLLWNNRTAGNNVLKMEYEVYGTGSFIVSTGLFNDISLYLRFYFEAFGQYYIQAEPSNIGSNLKQYNATTFPYNMWIKSELFIDYNTKKCYFYLPTLNLFRADDFYDVSEGDNIQLSGFYLKPGSVVKYDNIKLSALPTVPAYILSANEMVSAMFNMYPNPATNVVNITNAENILVEQITIYDMAGKQLNTQSFNNESQVQLNIENLASGNYMLRLQTNAGLAVKKLVKK